MIFPHGEQANSENQWCGWGSLQAALIFRFTLEPLLSPLSSLLSVCSSHTRHFALCMPGSPCNLRAFAPALSSTQNAFPQMFTQLAPSEDTDLYNVTQFL